MIDLHCHILPGIDDGARDLSESLDMARQFVAEGVTAVACTPHILPGVYRNTGPQIISATNALQRALDDADISLRLVTGADNHVVPDIVTGLRNGHLLTLANSRYVLIEPPHHVLPPRLEELFIEVQAAGYVPVLTHPERLTWIKQHYALIQRLVRTGTWMQITAGSLTGAFGRDAKYWAERMANEGLVHILATDAHDAQRRPPDLAKGREVAEKLIGGVAAEHLVVTRPSAVLANQIPSGLPGPESASTGPTTTEAEGRPRESRTIPPFGPPGRHALDGTRRGLLGRLRRLFD